MATLHVDDAWVERFGGIEALRSEILEYLEANYSECAEESIPEEDDYPEGSKLDEYDRYTLLGYLKRQPWACRINTVAADFAWTGKSIRTMVRELEQEGLVTVKNGLVNA
jgi:hypothetical protein